MRQQIVLIACLCSIAIVSGIPVPENNNELDVLQIPLKNGQELDVLSLGNSDASLSDRNKRTIGLLRELFPDLTKKIDDQANKIISQVIRALGPSILRTAIQGNNGGSGGGAASARDDFDADFDDDDDDSSSSSNGGSGSRVQIELPTFSPDDDDDDNDTTPTTAATKQNGKEIDLTMLNKQLEETIRVARQASENADNAENSLNEVSPKAEEDQQATESKSPALDELSLDSAEDLDGDDRNKRFLAFGGTKSVNAAPGSGNFLFDIVRQSTDRVIRAAGTMYEMIHRPDRNVASDALSDRYTNGYHYGGGDTFDLSEATENHGLFSGSIQPQSQVTEVAAGEAAVSTDDDSTRAADGYSEGIPGPVTRLAVLANRGFANLIQDLILRIAATSERLVNFKAKLITALI